MENVSLKRVFVSVVLVLLIGTIFSSVFAEGEFQDAEKAALAWLQSAVDSDCPPATYITEDPLIGSASYTYENAMIALALMSEGDFEHAKEILDAFADGMENDGEFNDRFRNAYAVGSPGDLPGYWNDAQRAWLQDAYQVGTGTKGSAAAVVALLTGYKNSPEEKYLNTAVAAIDWIIDSCQDSNPGFTSGYNGWPNAEDPNAVTILTYKSTADNIWMYAACKMLSSVTGWDKYSDAASSAYTFITEKMYASGDSRFFQGTVEDGITPAPDLILVDVQALAALCLDNDSGMNNIKQAAAADDGYSYDNSNKTGSWLEGTAIAALAWKEIGESEKAENVLNAMQKFQLPSGAFPQASIPELLTGELRVINDWPTTGATAWFIMAVNGFNPFSIIK